MSSGDHAQQMIPAVVVDARLSAIESQLKQLIDLVERLVRVEERQAQNQADIQALRIEQANLRSLLDVAKATSDRSKWSLDRIERVGWLAVTGLAMWLGKRFGG